MTRREAAELTVIECLMDKDLWESVLWSLPEGLKSPEFHAQWLTDMNPYPFNPVWDEDTPADIIIFKRILKENGLE